MSGAAFDRLMSQGRFWLRNVLLPDLVHTLRGRDDRPGTRLSPTDLGAARAVLNGVVGQVMSGAQATRVVGFFKSGGQNWALSWHQDRVIAVADRVEVSGVGNWTNKSGTWHCEPPERVLNRMIFARVLLDPVDERNGGMRFAPGSHRAGIVRKSDAAAAAARYPIETETGEAGDVLLLPMLTLHASAVSGSGADRCVLRVDFAADPLPPPLEWAV